MDAHRPDMHHHRFRDFAFGGRALVLDPNPTSRSILVSQLRDFGFSNVQSCSGVRDGRRLLEAHDFDVVLCEMDFPAGSPSGNELLEDLRRDNLLPLDTSFVMVSGEARYARVAEAAEAALDSYLLKPFNARALFERLHQSRHRKNELREIFLAVERQEHAAAADLCMARVQSRGPYWLYAARIGAELWLRLGQHERARTLLEEIVATQALPWARLGIARVQIETQQLAPARRTLEGLLAAEPTYADAYDVMGRVQVEQGDLDAALLTYRQAAGLTPGCISRQQKLGLMAFYAGDPIEAAKALSRATVLGMNSKSYDLQSLLLLGFLHFRSGDGKALRRVATDLARVLERAPHSRRLQRFVGLVEVLLLMQARQPGRVVQAITLLAEEIQAPDFDVEAACNLMTLLSEFGAGELQLERAEEWVDRLAQRFCTAKAFSELLASAGRAWPAYPELVQQRARQIQSLVERAVAYTLQGKAEAAVQAMLKHARSSLNPRFMDTAHGILQRHGAKVPQAAALGAELQALRERYATSVQIPPLGRTGVNPGGLSLRSDALARDSAPSPSACEPAPALA